MGLHPPSPPIAETWGPRGCLGWGGVSMFSMLPLPSPKISSTSNCTDYQSRRLNIMYSDGAGKLHHAHTVGAEPPCTLGGMRGMGGGDDHETPELLCPPLPIPFPR